MAHTPSSLPPLSARSQVHPPPVLLPPQTRALIRTNTHTHVLSSAVSSLKICLLKSKPYLNEQETIENEFHMAIAAEKSTSAASAAAAAASSAATATSGTAASASAPAATASPKASSRPASSVMLEEGLGDGQRQRGSMHRQPTVETKLNESGLMETSFVSSTSETRGDPYLSSQPTPPLAKEVKSSVKDAAASSSARNKNKHLYTI